MLDELIRTKDRFGLIKKTLDKKGIDFQIQLFRVDHRKGKNLKIRQPGDSKKLIVVSAHYDGLGAYDNASGVIVLFEVMNRLKGYYPKHNLEYVFFDREEQDQSGSRFYLGSLNSKEVVQHLDIDGFGIGQTIIGVGYMPCVYMRVGSKVLKFPCTADFKSFGERGIPAIHLFSLPEKEARNFVAKRLWPVTFDRLLDTTKDIPGRISRVDLEIGVEKMVSLIKELDRNKCYLNNGQIYSF